MIRVDSIVKHFDTITAVDGVSFEIRAGETFGLLGPNGAGKTTAINIITGLIRPDSGTVTVEGANGNELRRLIGNTPQAIALYEELTAHENLSFFGRLFGLAANQLAQRIEFSLQLAGLEERRHDRVTTFSGGMKRRLNLAASVVHDPQVLLLDEPTVGVDPQSRNMIFDTIEGLKSKGRTIIYTTHYMEEAQRLCDRVAIIDHGRVLALDRVEALISEYGGKALVLAELEKAPPDSVRLPGQLEGSSLRFESQAPLEEVTRLISSGVNFRTLRIERPDLESVFLNLTGRRLRD